MAPTTTESADVAAGPPPDGETDPDTGVTDRELDADRAAGGGPGAATRAAPEGRVSTPDTRSAVARPEPAVVTAVTTVELADGQALDGIDPTDPAGEMAAILDPVTTLVDPGEPSGPDGAVPEADPAFGTGSVPAADDSPEADPAFGANAGGVSDLVVPPVPSTAADAAPDPASDPTTTEPVDDATGLDAGAPASDVTAGNDATDDPGLFST